MDTKSVFSSDITRGHKALQNNLYDLVKVVPATPTHHKCEKENPCDFHPKNDKVYVPKKRNKFCKVKTVRDIRQLFEADVLTDLTKNLEKQQNLLLKKITGGSSRQEQTKALAKNMLKCDNPISRNAWQMLMNLNPEAHAHSIQYVLWNGRRIRVNGSKGGKNNFLCNFDLALRKTPKEERKNKIVPRKNCLLRKSLSIKFKPGPLSKKHILDDSHQKYNVGHTEIVNLPKPGLDIRSTYGVALEPSIAYFVQNLRDANGTISKKWADYAVSALGTLKDTVPIQNCDGSSVTFELNYKRNQKRMLMRGDYDRELPTIESYDNANSRTLEEDDNKINAEVKSVIDCMLNSVEISLQQDDMFTGEDEPRNTVSEDKHVSTIDVPKEKSRKRFCELDRLDVTIIRIPQASTSKISNTCLHSHCLLGCICASLQCEYNLKQHCGRLECVFDCKCEFTKYRGVDLLDNDCPGLIPGLINLDNELSLRLAKEEQRFHQTVVVTGEKSILLKPNRRNWKTSKRYSDFYSNMSLKNDVKSKRILTVIDVKLNCKNIEPWCMVHNLYKCFCKGKFTHKVKTDAIVEPEVNETISHGEDELTTSDCNTLDKNANRPHFSSQVKINQSISENSQTIENCVEITAIYCNSACARSTPYKGRKYHDTYYKNTNKKISEMEKNDDHLRSKITSILNKIDSDNSNCDVQDTSSIQFENRRVLRKRNLVLTNTIDSDISNDTTSVQCENSKMLKVYDESSNHEHETENDSSSYSSDNIINTNIKRLSTEISSNKVSSTTSKNYSVPKSVSNKDKLKSWLESSYQQYKGSVTNKAIIKRTLEPPKHGKAALHPWAFILSRYRERKNLFLVTKQKPYRIFMAIDIKNSFFDNCMNIDDIRFADLHKYPATIKNLLTNATDLKDNFCILCGLVHCWELIGSVTKVNDKIGNSEDDKTLEYDEETESERDETSQDRLSTDVKSNDRQVEVQVIPEITTDKDEDMNSDSSKWFVMTVEKDFTEIQFHNRGFFVKYESIIKAINVARMSGKTVRLSAQKCSDQNSGPQFGIYAIPNANEYYVFIGPYDKDEHLGIETVKSFSLFRKLKRTRGVWITTKKVDNIKVIDNPLSFMPPKNLQQSDIVSIENETVVHCSTENMQVIAQTSEALNDAPSRDLPKTVDKKSIKPIKIRKTNGFYHLASKNLVSLLKTNNNNENASNTTCDVSKSPLHSVFSLQQKNTSPVLTLPLSLNHFKEPTSNSPSSIKSVSNTKPVAEIAPQIKITNVRSESGRVRKNKTVNKNSDGGMFILKPEEINKRLMENKLMTAEPMHDSASDLDIDQDIESFLATSVIRGPPNADSLIISDEDDSNNEQLFNNSKPVWIECTNNEHIGWIKGRQRNNQISFEFPGFMFTDFYENEKAFYKINQVLSRKIYIPRSIKLEWRVMDNIRDLKIKKKLKSEDLGADFVLTKRGLRHRRDLMATTTIAKVSTDGGNESISTSNAVLEVDKAVDMMSDLEDQSKTLDDHSAVLMSELRTKMFQSIAHVPANQREQMSKTLQNFITASTEKSKDGKE